MRQGVPSSPISVDVIILHLRLGAHDVEGLSAARLVELVIVMVHRCHSHDTVPALNEFLCKSSVVEKVVCRELILALRQSF